MLQHQQEQPSEDAVVTAKELASAITALEARQQTGIERGLDSIALGEAIRQLGLGFSADELLAEIRTQREAAAAAIAAREERRRTRFRSTWLLAFPILTAIVALLLVGRIVSSVPSATFSRPVAVTMTAATPGHRVPIRTTDLLATGETRDVSLRTLYELTSGREYASVRLDRGVPGHWHLAPANGQLYVRVWTLREATGTNQRVYSDPPDESSISSQGVSSAAGSRYRAITVPLARFAGIRDPAVLVRSSRYTYPIEGVDLPVR